MNRKAVFAIMGSVAAVCFCVVGCMPEPTPAPVEKQPEHTFAVKGSVREMNIYPEMPEFPEGEGKSDFVTYCGICHSLKYISNQPNFPAKVWEAEVTKMVVKYHAPVDSVHAKKIVDYLVSIKGQ